MIFVLDDSPFNTIRVLVVPRALNESNKVALLQKFDDLNKRYKAIKYYFDTVGNIVLDYCIFCPDDKISCDLIYYDVLGIIESHLNDEYNQLIQLVN